MTVERTARRALKLTTVAVAVAGISAVAAISAVGGGAASAAVVPAPAHAGPHRPSANHFRSSTASTGYWVVDRGGGVAAGGGAPELGSLRAPERLAEPIVAMAATPDGGGYWLVSADGSVYTFGDAKFYGSAGRGRLHRVVGRVVGITPTRDGRGYWLASAEGGVYSFGDAKFYGAAHLDREDQVVAIAATHGGHGYWLASSNGSVFPFGDAAYHGSAAGEGRRIVGFARVPRGGGYWMATPDGAVLAYGDARSRASARPARPAPLVGMAVDDDGDGYWFANSAGTIYGFGAAKATGAPHLARGAVAIVADPALVYPRRAVPAPPGAPVEAGPGGVTSGGWWGSAAVRFALSQRGKPYVWGATGPYGYDCSGLAYASWRAAGVELPRTAAEQYGAGTHVPLSQVQPGDLVFWASDPAQPSTIYHVAISLGGDLTVQATETGQDVRVVQLWRGGGLVALATQP
ncbi:MAG: C40 family peptidase [Acidimicrobiales bacterium]